MSGVAKCTTPIRFEDNKGEAGWLAYGPAIHAMPSGYEKSPDYGDPPPNRWEWVYWICLALLIVAIFALLMR
jgi:hypothetical protein